MNQYWVWERRHLGLNGNWESEGHDRPDMELVGAQVALIEHVADARAVLERHLPGFAANAQMGMAAGLSLIQVAGFGPEQITQERLAAIGADLATL